MKKQKYTQYNNEGFFITFNCRNFKMKKLAFYSCILLGIEQMCLSSSLQKVTKQESTQDTQQPSTNNSAINSQADQLISNFVKDIEDILKSTFQDYGQKVQKAGESYLHLKDFITKNPDVTLSQEQKARVETAVKTLPKKTAYLEQLVQDLKNSFDEVLKQKALLDITLAHESLQKTKNIYKNLMDYIHAHPDVSITKSQKDTIKQISNLIKNAKNDLIAQIDALKAKKPKPVVK